MARQRKSKPFSALRQVLLGALLVLVAGIVALFLFGRSGREAIPRVDEGPVSEGVAPPTDRELTTVGKGFEFSRTEGTRTLFRITGETLQVDSEDNAYLEDVHLEFFDQGTRRYDLDGARGVFNQRKQEAHLEGGVSLRDATGFEMHAEAMDMRQEGRMVVSQGEVQMRYLDAYTGRADRMRIHFPQNLFLLAGRVRMDSTASAEIGFHLSSDRLFLEKDRQLVRADGQVRVRFQDSGIEAQRLNLFLTEDLSRVRFVRARWSVNGFLGSAVGPASAPLPIAALAAPAADGTANGTADGEEGSAESAAGTDEAGTGSGQSAIAETLDNDIAFDTADEALTGPLPDGAESPLAPGAIGFGGRSLSLLMVTEGQGFHSAEIDGSEEEPATLRFRTEEGHLATLTAGYLLGRFEDGVARGLEAYQGVEVVERGAEEAERVLRRLVGERGEGFLNPDGELSRMEVKGKASYQDPEVLATGDKISFDGASGKGELTGEQAKLVTARGEMVAPHLTFDRSSGILQADGGSRSLLRDPEAASGALAGSPLAAGEGPIRVEAEETFWRQEPSSYLFRGRVRAWRGANLILADSLRLEEADQRLEARGSVKTVWTPGPPKEAGVAPLPATTVTARELDYSTTLGVALYRGAVRAEQEGRILTSDEMELELDEEGQMERMTSRGSVKLDDPTRGNVVESDRVVYTLAEGLARFTGQPVSSRDREGRVVRAQQMVYDIRQGRVLAGGSSSQASETGETPPP